MLVESRIRLIAVLAGGLSLGLPVFSANQSQPARQATQSVHPQPDASKIFAQGEAALNAGDFDTAERKFEQVIAINPKAGPAYANLGVVYMRQKRWPQALDALQKAAKLEPKVAGIRLNIGLVYYRQGDFWHAIPPLESVVHDEPSSAQARYLLGLSYFSTERYVEASDTLEPLWSQYSSDMNYLYILSIAADKAEKTSVSERAMARMIAVGGDTPEFHLILGKAKLNEEAYDDAVQELTAAAEANPKLLSVHYYLGLALVKKSQYERARDEFLKDIAIEPDGAFNYSELGNVYLQLGKDEDAEKAFQQAVRLNDKMLEPHLGLAKVYQHLGDNDKALAQLDAAAAIDPNSSNIPYLRGQLLVKMGRKDEGKKELERSVAMSHEQREKRHQELESPAPDAPANPN